MNLTNEQLAYLAGLIDGEGSVECQRYKQKNAQTHRYVLRLSFVMATPEPLETVGSWLDCNVRIYPATTPNRSPRHRLHIPKNKAIVLLNACMPYLILKKKQAQLVLDIEKVRSQYTPDRKDFGKQGGTSKPMPQIALDKMHELYCQLRSLKSNKRQWKHRTMI